MAGKEELKFNPEFDWTPDDTMEVANGEDMLHLRWDNTTVFRYSVGEGKYDHVHHLDRQAKIYQFFLDDPDLRHDLEQRGYPYIVLPFVSEELAAARTNYEIAVATQEFANELESIVPEDFL